MEEESHDTAERKNRRDPISGIFKGLIVIFLGVSFLLCSLGIVGWSRWLALFLFGLGCIFLIEVLVRNVVSKYRKPSFGRLIWGLVLVFIGGVFLYGGANWWPFVIIAAGVAILVRAVLKLRR